MAVAARSSIGAEVSYLDSRIKEEKLILEMLEDEVESASSRRETASRQLEDLRNTLMSYGMEIPNAEELEVFLKQGESEAPHLPNLSPEIPPTHAFERMLLDALSREHLDDASIFTGYSSAAPSHESPAHH